MESKTKHRILGFLAILGLIVILLPFFQAGKDTPVQTTVVQAPPFPDQAVQVSSTTLPETSSPLPATNEAPSISKDDRSEPPKDITNTFPEAALNQAPSSEETPSSQDMARSTEEGIKEGSKTDPLLNTHTKKGLNRLTSHLRENRVTPKYNRVSASSRHLKAGEIISLSEYNKSLQKESANGLVNLHQAAWVIQIGSFKEKANAIRLVNQLRSKGYKAFIQQISTVLGDSTRVFIGPESKHTHAREIASRLATDMHLQGIVISYKPLAL